MLRRLFKRLAQDETDRRAEEIRRWAETVPGTTSIARAQSRSVVRLAGVVESLRVMPREGVPSIEAVVSDGTGQVTAIWLGRRSVPGLMLGARLVLEGRLGGNPIRLQLMNPVFEFAPPPER